MNYRWGMDPSTVRSTASQMGVQLASLATFMSGLDATHAAATTPGSYTVDPVPGDGLWRGFDEPSADRPLDD